MATKKAPQRSYTSVMGELKKIGTAQNRKVYGRHGVSGAMFGVSFAHQNRLAKEIKSDHELALKLWASKNHDARVLATMIVDIEKMTAKDLESWAKDLDNYVVSDSFVKVAARTKHAHKKAEAWRKKTKKEWICRMGWMLTASIASRNDPADAGWLKELIPVVVQEIHGSKNRIKDAMNYALIAIGGTHNRLTKPALAAADKMGVVEVDHGETGCKTRPAREYIEAMLKRKEMTAAKAGKKVTKKKAKARSVGGKTAAKKAPAKKVAKKKASSKKTAKKNAR